MKKNINVITIVKIKLGNIFLKILRLSSLFQAKRGPTPITKIAGIIIGMTVELK